MPMSSIISIETLGAPEDGGASTGPWSKKGIVTIRFDITVPETTPPDAAIYVSGSLGTLGNWKAAGLKAEKIAEGRYEARTELPVGAALQFKVTRGTWSTGEVYPSGLHRPNRFRHIRRSETFKVIVARWADCAPRQRGPQGLNVRHSVPSSYLEEGRNVLVHLPPGYDEDDARAYPLLILHDGQNLFDDATAFAGVKWGVDEAVDRLVREGRMEPVIVAGVWNSPAREQEYHPDRPRAERYLHFLTDELIPFLREHYRILPERAGIAGSSMGGIISLHFAERRRDIFTRVGALSPSIWAGGRVIQRLEEFPLEPEGRRLWLDMGTCEGRPETWQGLHHLHGVLEKQGWSNELHYREVQGARHSEWFWAQRLPEVLTALYPPLLTAEQAGHAGAEVSFEASVAFEEAA
jgi:enterochelin esterase-like enzyme